MCVTSFWSTVSYLLWRGTRSLFFNQVMDRTNVTTYDDDDPFFLFLNLQALLYNQPLLNSYQCIFRSHLNSHRLTRRYRKIGNLSGFLFCSLSLSLTLLEVGVGNSHTLLICGDRRLRLTRPACCSGMTLVTAVDNQTTAGLHTHTTAPTPRA